MTEANWCQPWVSTASWRSLRTVFCVVRLAGFEPATGCLEGTANMASTVRDVHFLGPMTRYQSGQAEAVTTNDGYRVG